MRYSAILVLLIVFLVGCGKNDGDDIKGKVEGAKEKIKHSAENVWSGQVETLDKAKSVGKTLMDSAEEERRKIEKQGE